MDQPEDPLDGRILLYTRYSLSKPIQCTLEMDANPQVYFFLMVQIYECWQHDEGS